MEKLKSRVVKFIETLQTCNKQQQDIFLEIMEGLHKFIEEIFFSRHISVGNTATVNVQELLYSDLLELVRHLKMSRKHNEEMHQAMEDAWLENIHENTAIICSKREMSEKEDEEGYFDMLKAMEDDRRDKLHKNTAIFRPKREINEKEDEEGYFDVLKAMEDYRRVKRHKNTAIFRPKREMSEKEDEEEYFDMLKAMEDDRLDKLHKNTAIFRSKREIKVQEILDVKMKEQERADLMEFLTVAANILQDVILMQWGYQELNQILQTIGTHRMTYSCEDEVFEFNEINKRNLGKIIIRLVGHEGTDMKPGLRRLLQACIDFLQTEQYGADVWKNASFTIYDEDDDMYKIVSGTKKHQFICRMNDGEPSVKEKFGRHPHKKSKACHQQQSTPPASNMHEKMCNLM